MDFGPISLNMQGVTVPQPSCACGAIKKLHMPTFACGISYCVSDDALVTSIDKYEVTVSN